MDVNTCVFNRIVYLRARWILK